MEGEPVAFDREAPYYLHEELSNEGTTSESSSFWGLTHAVFFLAATIILELRWTCPPPTVHAKIGKWDGLWR